MIENSGATSNKSMTDPRLARLEAAMSRGGDRSIDPLLDQLLSRSALIPRLFPHIQSLFAKHGKEDALAAAVLRTISTVKHRLDAAFVFSDFARERGILPDLIGIIAAKEDPSQNLRISPPMRPLRFFVGGPDDPRLADLLRIKYSRIKFPDCISDVEAAARILAGQVDIPPECIEFLYPRTVIDGISQDEWVSAIQVATALDEIVVDFDLLPVDVRPLFHPDTAAVLNSAGNGRTGTIFLTAHLGFAGARFALIRAFMKDVLPIRRESTKPPYIWQMDDNKAALFSALKALAAGTSIFIAPDGPMGGVTQSVDILGKRLPVGKGAAFLAYETGAPLAWIDMELHKGQFKPSIVLGPSRNPGEKMSQFQNRFCEFIQDRATLHFTGDPRHIVSFSIFRLLTLDRRRLPESPG